MDRVNIFKVMTIFIPIGALLFDFGDVTKKCLSIKIKKRKTRDFFEKATL